MTAREMKLLVEARAAAKEGTGVAARRAAGLSQGELARAIGVDHSTLSRWEAQKRRPSGVAALRYAQMLRTLAGVPR